MFSPRNINCCCHSYWSRLSHCWFYKPSLFLAKYFLIIQRPTTRPVVISLAFDIRSKRDRKWDHFFLYLLLFSSIHREWSYSFFSFVFKGQVYDNIYFLNSSHTGSSWHYTYCWSYSDGVLAFEIMLKEYDGIEFLKTRENRVTPELLKRKGINNRNSSFILWAYMYFLHKVWVSLVSYELVGCKWEELPVLTWAWETLIIV